MKFVPMDPNTILDLLKDQQDILTPAVKAHQQLLEAVPCAACGSQGSDRCLLKPTKRADGSFSNLPFRDGQPNIQGYAKCRRCGVIFEPISRVIISRPTS